MSAPWKIDDIEGLPQAETVKVQSPPWKVDDESLLVKLSNAIGGIAKNIVPYIPGGQFIPGLSSIYDKAAKDIEDLKTVQQNISVTDPVGQALVGKDVSPSDWTPQIGALAEQIRQREKARPPEMKPAGGFIPAPAWERTPSEYLAYPKAAVEEIASGLSQVPRTAGNKLAAGIAGTVQSVGEMLNMPSVAAHGNNVATNLRKELVDQNLQNTKLQNAISENVSQAALNVPALAFGLAGNIKNAILSLGPFGMQVFGTSYNQYRGAGKEPSEALRLALSQAAQEVGTEGFGPASAALARRAGAGLLGANIANAAGDLGGEMASSLYFDPIIGYISGEGLPNREQLNQAAIDTLVATLIQGGAGSAIATPIVKAYESSREGALADLANYLNIELAPIAQGQLDQAVDSLYQIGKDRGENIGAVGRQMPVVPTPVAPTYGAPPQAIKQPAQGASLQTPGTTLGALNVAEGGRIGDAPLKAEEFVREINDKGISSWEMIPDSILESVAPKGFSAGDIREIGRKIINMAESGNYAGKEWYDNAAKYILDMFGGDEAQAENFIKAIAITSSATEVGSNAALAMKAWEQFANGKPIKGIGLGKEKSLTDQLYFGKDWSGLKTNTFYLDLISAMRNQPTQFSTQDMHMGNLVFGQEKLSPKQYRALEEATRLASEVVGILPRELQAAAWVPQKAKTIFEYYRSRGWKNELTDQQLYDYAFEIALRDYSYYLKQSGYKPTRVEVLPEARRAAVTEITAEVVPSPSTPEGEAIMAMPTAFRQKFNKEMVKAINLQALSDAVGLNAAVRVEEGFGGYLKDVQPNMIVEVVPRSGRKEDIDRAAIERFALAWMYAHRQNSVPFFRGDTALIDKEGADIGVKFFFPQKPTLNRLKGLMNKINEVMGDDAGFTEIDGEIYIINFGFLGKDRQQFIDEARKVAENYGSEIEITGVEDVYPDEHDWQADPTGIGIIERIKASAPGLGDIQKKLDRIAAPGRKVTEKFAKLAAAELAKQRSAELSGNRRQEVNVGYSPGTFQAGLNVSSEDEEVHAQTQWMSDQAASLGYQSIDDLLRENQEAFFNLAEQWRRENGRPLNVDGLYGPFAIRMEGGVAVPESSFKHKLDERSMMLRGVEPLGPKQQAVINGALADIARAGLPRYWMDGVTFYGKKPTSSGYATYYPSDNSIGVDWTHIDKAKTSAISQLNIRGWLAHELHHRIDHYKTAGNRDFYISAESPRMAVSITPDRQLVVEGDLVTEAHSLWESGALRRFLNYPFNSAKSMLRRSEYSSEEIATFVKIETFAQIGSLWITNRALVEEMAPTWAQMFKEWESDSERGSIAGDRNALHRALWSSNSEAGAAGLGGRPGVGTGIGSLNAASAGQRGTNQRVGGIPSVSGVNRGQAALSNRVGQHPTAQEYAKAYGFLAGHRAQSSVIPGDHVPTHVNYRYILPLQDYKTISKPDDIKAQLAKMSRSFEQEIQAQRRGRVSNEQTIKEAAALLGGVLGVSGKTALDLSRKPGAPINAAELKARKELAIVAADSIEQTMQKLEKRISEVGGDMGKIPDSELVEFYADIERAGMIFSQFLGARAEAGRALQILQNTQAIADRAAAYQEIIDAYKGKGNIQNMLQVLQSVPKNNVAGRLRAAASLSNPTILDAVLEVWRNFMMGVTTQIANLAGNTTFSAMRIPQHLLAGLFGKMHISDRDKVYIGETLAMAYGMVMGVGAGARNAWLALQGKDYDASQKTESHVPAFTAATFRAKGRLGKIIDAIGVGVRHQYALLGVGDALFRGMNASGSIYAGALRQALKEGKRYWDSGFWNRVSQLVNEAANAIAVPGARVSGEAQAIADEAIKDAAEYTFNAKLGVIGQSLMRLRANIKSLTFIFPFVRTPMNIFRKSLEMTPFAPMSAQWRSEIAAGGHRRDVALAQIATGAAISMLVYSLFSQGLITGGGDPDHRLRARRHEAGIPDYAVKIGDTWYSYRRLEPVGTLIGMAADVMEFADYMTQEDAEHVGTMLSMMFAQAVTSKTFWQGLSQLVNATADPERYGNAFVQGFAASMVPAYLAEYNEMYGDRLVRDRGVYGMNLDKWHSAIETVKNAIKSRIPKTQYTPEFNSESLPAKRNLWGEPIAKEERMHAFSPIRIGRTTDDPVKLEAYNLRLDESMPQKSVRGVKLTPEEYWNQLVGPSGQVAHEAMSRIMETPAWGALSAYQKKEVFKRVIEESRNAYRNGMIAANQELLNKIIEKERKKINAEPDQPRAR